MSPSALNTTPQATDPTKYDLHHQTFSSTFPSNEKEWIERAGRVAAILAEDVTTRDREQKVPEAEISLLKSSGLLKTLGPTNYGGGGQGWDVGYKVIREVAKGDGSVGMLLGYHLLWSYTAHVVGTDEQRDRFEELIIKNNYFIGGAVNPRDSDLKITSEGDHIVFEGFKNFNTGGVVSDLTVLEGTFEGTDAHIFAYAPTQQAGIQFAHNWHNMGLRLTESGSVKIDRVAVPWADALGWDPKTQKPLAQILNIPWATLLLPTIQLVFSNFYLGIAHGALSFSLAYTAKNTRPWPFTPSPAPSGVEEFYILERYGNFHAHLAAATALANQAGSVISSIYATKSSARETLTARERGEAAEEVAAVKVVATDTALRVTSGVFETTGARATAEKVGLDRFWRDVRTHTLHDPVAYKNRELGRYALLDEIPEPSWYT
ncbi:MAG: hypothetical protein M1820_006932 [Bogoriella megaspora]|nr:MAG: hypothetical protein M1820_006932 [Bogoriella megaspora]